MHNNPNDSCTTKQKYEGRTQETFNQQLTAPQTSHRRPVFTNHAHRQVVIISESRLVHFPELSNEAVLHIRVEARSRTSATQSFQAIQQPMTTYHALKYTPPKLSIRTVILVREEARSRCVRVEPEQLSTGSTA